jgi:hypothetical protein
VARVGKHEFGGKRNARRYNRGDRLLVENEEPPLGSHLVTPRRGFAHHGIYVGRGNVVHYRSVVRRFCRGPVEEVSLAGFAQKRAIWVRSHSAPRFDGIEVRRRARSRLGEDRYRLLSNNCEHFCEWCLRDEQRSLQVERLLALPRRLARVCREVLARMLAEDDRVSGQPIYVLRPLPPDRST